MISKRRRALLASKGAGGSYSPTFGIKVETTEYYQWGDIVSRFQYVISTNYLDKLVGSDSEYVIIMELPYEHMSGSISMKIIPRKYMNDPDYSSYVIPFLVTSDGDMYQNEEFTTFYFGGDGMYNSLNEKSTCIALDTQIQINPTTNSYYILNPSECTMIDDFWANYFMQYG